jgi:hypothetical protein
MNGRTFLLLATTIIGGCAAADDPCSDAEGSGECAGEQELAAQNQELWGVPSFSVRARVDPAGGGTATVQTRRLGSSCNADECEVPLGGRAVLSAVAATDYHFLRWSGCSDSSESEISLRFVRENLECVAHFVPNTVLVQAFVVGQYRGATRITAPGSSCSSQGCVIAVPYGTVVTIEPISSPSYRFVSWSECSTSTEPVLVIAAETSQRTLVCKAIVEPITAQVSWSVAAAGGGSIRIGHTGPDIRCDESSCQVVVGASIGLEAVPDAGFAFAGWTGCSDSSAAILEVSDVQAPRHCEAHFVPLP